MAKSSNLSSPREFRWIYRSISCTTITIGKQRSDHRVRQPIERAPVRTVERMCRIVCGTTMVKYRRQLQELFRSLAHWHCWRPRHWCNSKRICTTNIPDRFQPISAIERFYLNECIDINTRRPIDRSALTGRSRSSHLGAVVTELQRVANLIGCPVVNEQLREDGSIDFHELFAFILQGTWKNFAHLIQGRFDSRFRFVVLNDIVQIADHVFAQGTFGWSSDGEKWSDRSFLNSSWRGEFF